MSAAPNGRDTRNVSVPSRNLATVTRPATHLLRGDEVQALLHIARTTRHRWTGDGILEAIRHHAKGPWMYPADQPVIAQALRAVGADR